MDTARALIQEPQQHKLLAKFDEICSAEKFDVYLLNGCSKLEPERRVYKLSNNSHYLLDDPRINEFTVLFRDINFTCHIS